ncbi:MAG: hypothetical protein WC623_21175 [Pedobacter sp.]|uniref:hypothetical protein n=1 Tax=Pedobacter sp. TaxID=1411316 RepID=UPI00356268D2
MKKLLIIPMCILFIALSCKKDKTPAEEKEVIKGNIKQVTETVNGITYKIFTDVNTTNFKGILVVGSGNDESNPSEGSINGASETALCEKAAANGYAAAIVRYQKPAAGTDWDSRSKLMGEDFDKAIVGLVDGVPFISKNLPIRDSLRDNTSNIEVNAVFGYEFDENDRMLAQIQTSKYTHGAETTDQVIKGKFEYKCN